MKPNRPTKPLQLDRHTLRQLAAKELASVPAGVGTGTGTGAGTYGVCPTDWFC